MGAELPSSEETSTTITPAADTAGATTTPAEVENSTPPQESVAVTPAGVDATPETTAASEPTSTPPALETAKPTPLADLPTPNPDTTTHMDAAELAITEQQKADARVMAARKEATERVAAAALQQAALLVAQQQQAQAVKFDYAEHEKNTRALAARLGY